ncbi:MAG: hypothetical protein N3E47_03995 [Candidatus Bathyarchaeota archaeon]|nr:hypothetical protein [Candidatus Bathyarchaeota archaeon]
MGQKLKMMFAIIMIGFIGFILGAVANFLYVQVFPAITEIFPQIFASEWIIWGFTGAFLAVACCLIYALLP